MTSYRSCPHPLHPPSLHPHLDCREDFFTFPKLKGVSLRFTSAGRTSSLRSLSITCQGIVWCAVAAAHSLSTRLCASVKPTETHLAARRPRVHKSQQLLFAGRPPLSMDPKATGEVGTASRQSNCRGALREAQRPRGPSLQRMLLGSGLSLRLLFLRVRSRPALQPRPHLLPRPSRAHTQTHRARRCRLHVLLPPRVSRHPHIHRKIVRHLRETRPTRRPGAISSLTASIGKVSRFFPSRPFSTFNVMH